MRCSVVCRRASRGADTLRGLLREQGVLAEEEDADARVSWGVRLAPSELPTLNARAGWDKYEELRQLEAAGVNALRAHLEWPGAPSVGRMRKHAGGRSLPVYNEPPGSSEPLPDYYVPWVDMQREFRVYTFRRQVLASYEKLGGSIPIRSYGFGWRMRRCALAPPVGVRAIAKQATAALGLDFAGVDVGWTPGGAVVIEVNSAPGVAREPLAWMRALATEIGRGEWLDGRH